MNKTRLFKKTLLAVTVSTVTLASQQALAAGFQLNAQSATGIGRAFAGDAVIADNASVMARNPAAMALFDETALSLGFETIITDIEVKDAKYTGATRFIDPSATSQESNFDNAGSTSVAPNIHLIVPINEKFAVGANVYSNFGTRTDFDSSFVGGEYGGDTEIMSLNFGLAGSYRLNEQWSFGAGLDLIYGQGTLKRNFSDSFYSGPNPGGALDDIVALNGSEIVNIEEADGWGVGFNVGTVFELDENNRFGLSYRYSPEITAEDGSQKITLPLPDMAEFSGYHRIEDTKFAVHYSIQYIGWSAFDVLEIDTGSSKAESVYDWQDGWHYAIGGTYYLNNDWTLRAGYMHDTSAQDKVTSISVPDSDRNWFSAGFTYHIDSKSNIDFGFTYLVGEDVKVNEATNIDVPAGVPILGGQSIEASSITGTTRANAILVGLQYSRSF